MPTKLTAKRHEDARTDLFSDTITAMHPWTFQLVFPSTLLGILFQVISIGFSFLLAYQRWTYYSTYFILFNPHHHWWRCFLSSCPQAVVFHHSYHFSFFRFLQRVLIILLALWNPFSHPCSKIGHEIPRCVLSSGTFFHFDNLYPVRVLHNDLLRRSLTFMSVSKLDKPECGGHILVFPTIPQLGFASAISGVGAHKLLVPRRTQNNVSLRKTYVTWSSFFPLFSSRNHCPIGNTPYNNLSCN